MKCDKCPVVGRCIAEDPAHAYACKFADSPHASERRWLEDASAMVAGRPIPEAKPAPAVPPPRPAAATADDSRNPQVGLTSDFADNLAKVQSCRSRTDGPECGCTAMMRCLKYRKDVSLNDCLTCVAAGLDDPPTPRDRFGPGTDRPDAS